MGTAFKTTIGGAAVMEGIMMRGPEKAATVVRLPGGENKIKFSDKKPLKLKFPVLGLPFIRGVVGLIESMALSFEALNFSADAIASAELEGDAKEGDGSIPGWMMALTMLLGVAIAMALFVVLPIYLIGLLAKVVELGWSRAVLEGLLRLVIFIAYIFLVSRLKDIQRVFAYHGAEHKVIACYEAGCELTVENARRYTRFHPRCGTSFLAMVILLGIVLFLWVSVPNVFLRVLYKFAMLPLLFGIAYEINRWLGKSDSRAARIIRAPGLWVQRITTKEPDDTMLEVGIEALKLVMPETQGEDEWK